MITLEQLDKKIKLLKEKLKNVKGTTTEVYTRIVGYFRNVNNYNPGKVQEYKERKTFDVDKSMHNLQKKNGE